MTILITDLRCECGSPDIIAIDPGQQGDNEAQLMLIFGLDYEHERPVRARCVECWPKLSVDVTRSVAHNEKPLTAVKAVSGLSLTKRRLGGCVGGPLHPHPTQASTAGQGGFAP